MMKLAAAGQRQFLCFMLFASCNDIINNELSGFSWQDVIYARTGTQLFLHTNYIVILNNFRYFTLRILNITKMKRISETIAEEYKDYISIPERAEEDMVALAQRRERERELSTQ